MGALLALTWLASRAGAATDPTLFAFQIDKQPMAKALNSLAIQANCQMFFEDSAVAGMTAPTVTGMMSTADALHLLLAHTPLEYSQEDGGAIIVRRKAAAVAAAAAPKRRKPAAHLAEVAPTPAVEGPKIVPAPAAPEEGHWMIGLRGARLYPAAPNNAKTSSRWLAELDLEYFYSPHWSGELASGTPRRYTMSLPNSRGANSGVVGSYTQLPAYLTVKYTFLPDATWRPYVGAGMNVISRYQVDASPYSVSSTTVGPAAQVGVNANLGHGWFLNADIKWAWSRPDLRFEGTEVSTVKVDPFVYGIGVAYRFGHSPR
jgi:outer membrane protein